MIHHAKYTIYQMYQYQKFTRTIRVLTTPGNIGIFGILSTKADQVIPSQGTNLLTKTSI